MTSQEEKYWDQLEDYFYNRLTAEEVTEFESWLNTNYDAQQTLDGFKALQKKFPNEDDKKAFFQKQSNTTLSKLNIGKKKPIYLYIAASLTAIVAVVAWFVLDKTNLSAETLLAQYSEEHYSAPFITRDEVSSPNWVSLYNNKEHAQVIKILNGKTDLEIKEAFYLSLSYFYTNQFSVAIDLLQPIANSENIFNEQARWYMSLAYLNMVNKNEAKKLLIRINKTKGYKYKEAEKLLQSM